MSLLFRWSLAGRDSTRCSVSLCRFLCKRRGRRRRRWISLSWSSSGSCLSSGTSRSIFRMKISEICTSIYYFLHAEEIRGGVWILQNHRNESFIRQFLKSGFNRLCMIFQWLKVLFFDTCFISSHLGFSVVLRPKQCCYILRFVSVYGILIRVKCQIIR